MVRKISSYNPLFFRLYPNSVFKCLLLSRRFELRDWYPKNHTNGSLSKIWYGANGGAVSVRIFSRSTVHSNCITAYFGRTGNNSEFIPVKCSRICYCMVCGINVILHSVAKQIHKTCDLFTRLLLASFVNVILTPPSNKCAMAIPKN